MDSSFFKTKVRELLNRNVSFLGNNKEQIITQISDTQFDKILSWLDKILSQEVRPLHPKRNKDYKGVSTNQLLVFRYALTIEGSAYRILLVKIKNKYYWEFHLGKHNYYDTVRKKLFLR